MSNTVTIFPSVTEANGVEDGPSVVIYPSVSEGNTSGLAPFLLLMSGSNVLLMTGGFLSLV